MSLSKIANRSTSSSTTITENAPYRAVYETGSANMGQMDKTLIRNPKLKLQPQNVPPINNGGTVFPEHISRKLPFSTQPEDKTKKLPVQTIFRTQTWKRFFCS